MVALARSLQTAANVGAAGLLVWLAAPLFSVGGRHPFDGAGARLLLFAGMALATAAAWAAMRAWRRHRQARLAAELQAGHAAAEQLRERFDHAMHLLRSGIAVGDGTRTPWWQRPRMVYQLPWYLFVGAPGAGKTTALLRSGLRFPLAERLGRAPVAGVGGTRQCDWWFTDQAVFIDTAGRYTTQDSHAAGDAHEWQRFLQLLRRQRPVQPVNGVIVTVSVPDLLRGGAELEHQAAAVDLRLQELRRELGLSFPVYVLVTKVDLLAGFVEFFGSSDAPQREQPWGVTFDLDGAGDAPALPADLGPRLAALAARVAALTPRRMQEEPLQQRAAIYAFAAQVQSLLPEIEDFVRRATRHCADAPRQPVRGIHLTSGTQEGNPVDRVLGELSRGFGVPRPEPARADGAGKAYFLSSLLQRLVIAEAPLAGHNQRRARQRRWLSGAVAGALAALLLGACAAWGVSYRHNVAYVAAVDERVRKAMQQVDGSSAALDRLLPLYAVLRDVAGAPDTAAPWSLDLGLFQGARLARSADQTYRHVLDNTLAPLLVARLTETLRQSPDAGARYEALRIGLMLVTPDRLQRGEVQRWASSAFGAPGQAGPGAQAPGDGEQQEWRRHLDALLERNAVQDAARLDDATVRAARTALANLPLEQRVHERLLSRARAAGGNELTLAELASPAAVLAFAPADTKSTLPPLPAVFTRQAWNDTVERAIEPVIAEVADETDWVLGQHDVAAVRLVTDRAAHEPLARQVALRHAQAVMAQWDRLLGALALQAPADAQALGRFATTLAGGDSPLRLLLRRLAAEFALSPAATASVATQAYDAALGAHFAALRDYAAGPGPGAIDRLLVPLPTLLLEPTSPRAAELARALRAEAAGAPPPFQGVWTTLAEALDGQRKRALEREIGRDFAEFAQTCRRLTADRFPFVADAKRDMPTADFARVFGPQGLIDSFFRSRLATQVDTRQRPWRALGTAELPAHVQAALRSFEMAADIQRLFFPPGAELPRLQLRLTPTAMDSELLLFSADVDGQLLRYENGPQRTKPIAWPGPAASQRVLLRILPAGPSGVGAEVHEGPWALLRVLQRGGWQRGQGAVSSARLQVDGRSLTVDVTAEGQASAALLGELSHFRCPEPAG